MSIINEVLNGVKLRESKVGAFYVIKGKVYSDATPVRDGDTGSTANFVDGYLSHYDLWYNVIAPKLGLSTRDYEYDDFPRGRVVFDKGANKYRILADKKILNDSSILRDVTSEFSLKSGAWTTMTDSHYQSIRGVR